MTGHTKEPWVIHNPADGYEAGFVVDAQAYHVADCNGGRTPEQDEANAARIVSCINALAGISDPAAFVEAARGMAEALEPFIRDWDDAGVPLTIEGRCAMISVDLECGTLTVGEWRRLADATTTFRAQIGEA